MTIKLAREPASSQAVWKKPSGRRSEHLEAWVARHDVIGPSWSGASTSAALAVLISVVIPGCSRQIADGESGSDDVDLFEHRVEPCQRWCEIEISPECGIGQTPAYEDLEGCIRECATADGLRSSGWGYQPTTMQDVCVGQWADHYECVASLDCDAQRFYFRGSGDDLPPQEERPCWAEWREMMDCQNASVEGQ